MPQRPVLLVSAALGILASLSSCPVGAAGSAPRGTVAGYEAAREEVLRQIPAAAIAAAKSGLHIAYQHTSHGTHVAYGLFGLPGYKPGDEALFAVTNGAETPVSGSLDFHDYAVPGAYPDLSQADNGDWAVWLDQVRAYLDDESNADINAMMWSWCSIAGHDAFAYLESMQTLIDEYGTGGSKLGVARLEPVTFIFMTGHAELDSNAGPGLPRDQAALITEFCEANGYWCLDYYSIETHGMDGTYYEDAGDDADSAQYGGNFFKDWQDVRTEGVDWYANRESPGGDPAYGEHLSQHVTANRKAYAMWYLLARIAGWNGRL